MITYPNLVALHPKFQSKYYQKTNLTLITCMYKNKTSTTTLYFFIKYLIEIEAMKPKRMTNQSLKNQSTHREENFKERERERCLYYDELRMPNHKPAKISIWSSLLYLNFQETHTHPQSPSKSIPIL